MFTFWAPEMVMVFLLLYPKEGVQKTCNLCQKNCKFDSMIAKEKDHNHSVQNSFQIVFVQPDMATTVEGLGDNFSHFVQ